MTPTAMGVASAIPGPSRASARLGALSVIWFAVVGVAWIALEIAPVSLGLADGDDPAVALGYLRAHPDSYVGPGSVLVLMAIALAVGAFAVSDALGPRADSLALRSASVLGQFSAAFFLMFGVLRLSTGPLLYIDSLDRGWGEAAYLIVQVVGVHGFGQAGVFALCLWAIGISLIGLRTRALPVAICLLGVIPAIRILGLLGPLGVLPDDMLEGLWIVFMLSIPGVMLWCLFLGTVLLRRTFGTTAPAAPAMWAQSGADLGTVAGGFDPAPGSQKAGQTAGFER